MAYTSAADFQDSYSTLQKTFASGKTKSLAWRKWQLKQVWWMLEDNEERLIKALNKDLNRHDFESTLLDVTGLKRDVLDHITHLEEWTADEKIAGAGVIFGFLGGARLRKEPLGIALVIGAWNVPFSLLLQPTIAAIAAGCAVLLKPSEFAENTQALLVEIIPKYMDPQGVRLVTAGPAEMGKILEHKFDHIFYTGSSNVARIVCAAAAKHLTPVVLECGGQDPAIVLKSADVNLAAKRIAWSKFMNAGQICLSANHVFCDPAIFDEFVDRLTYWSKAAIAGGQEKMTSIINERNFDRVAGLLEKTEGKVVYGGETDRSKKFIHPTVVIDLNEDDSLLSEELFGPICPVVKADYVSAYKKVSSMPTPLALYIFGKDQKQIDEILDNTNSGGVTINDIFMHASVPNAPFGGVGESGQGAYHGSYGIKAFQHERTVVAPPTWMDKLLSFRYAPFNTESISKLAVKNSIGFNRGETMADQKVKSQRLGGSSSSGGLVVKALLVLAVLEVIDYRTGRRMGVSDWVQRLVGSVSARLRG